jgi:hypothetical protein
MGKATSIEQIHDVVFQASTSTTVVDSKGGSGMDDNTNSTGYAGSHKHTHIHTHIPDTQEEGDLRYMERTDNMNTLISQSVVDTARVEIADSRARRERLPGNASVPAKGTKDRVETCLRNLDTRQGRREEDRVEEGVDSGVTRLPLLSTLTNISSFPRGEF